MLSDMLFTTAWSDGFTLQDCWGGMEGGDADGIVPLLLHSTVRIGSRAFLHQLLLPIAFPVASGCFSLPLSLCSLLLLFSFPPSHLPAGLRALALALAANEKRGRDIATMYLPAGTVWLATDRGAPSHRNNESAFVPHSPFSRPSIKRLSPQSAH
jgi:hypothetical protein